MKKAFTLVEMLVVVAILAVLMTIVFRLGSLGGSDWRRTQTIVKLQKVENCLSGYYAAFGSYPPVKVHGYRDITQKVDMNGDQTESNASGNLNQSESGSSLVSAQVIAACRSQPFGCEYPPNREDTTGDSGSSELSEQEVIEEWSKEVKARVGNSADYPLYSSGKWAFASIFQGSEITGPNAGDFGNEWENPSWHTVKLFKFGVMSFLLPRYLFMMSGDGQFVGTGGRNACAQWGDNNDLPSNPLQGDKFDDWDSVRDDVQVSVSDGKKNRSDLARVANIPSQAVCARWMPNLEETCHTVKKKVFFGINVSSSTGISPGWEDANGDIQPPDPGTHSLKGGKNYRNAFVTIYDGWGTELFYYSPAPYQTYTIWSAGPNYKTFPPWMDIDSLSNPTDRETAQKWKNDDIMQMSH